MLGGSGLAWQDEAVHEVRGGDRVVHCANEMEHTFRAGPGGLEYLVYGTNHPTEYGWLSRSRAIRLSWPWVEGHTDNPWDVEAQVEPRPDNIVNLDVVGAEEEDGLVSEQWSLLQGFLVSPVSRSLPSRMPSPTRGSTSVRAQRAWRRDRPAAVGGASREERKERTRALPPCETTRARRRLSGQLRGRSAAGSPQRGVRLGTATTSTTPPPDWRCTLPTPASRRRSRSAARLTTTRSERDA